MNSVENWLRENYRRQLHHVLGEIYVRPDSVVERTLQFLWFQFEGTQLSRVRLGSNGCEIHVDLEAPQSCDMGEYGRTYIDDLANVAPFRNCIGSILSSANLLELRNSGDPAGFYLQFSSGAGLIIVNWGDDFLVTDHMTEEILEDEDFTIRTIL